MQAMTHTRYGSPDVLHLADVPTPTPKADEVLVQVHAAGVNPANVSQTTNSVLEEFARLAATPPTAAELADSQAYLTGILPLTLETNEGVANTILSMVWHDLGLDYLYRYADIINGVGVEDVQRVAHAYLRPACTVLSIAGPQGA